MDGRKQLTLLGNSSLENRHEAWIYCCVRGSNQTLIGHAQGLQQPLWLDRQDCVKPCMLVRRCWHLAVWEPLETLLADLLGFVVSSQNTCNSRIGLHLPFGLHRQHTHRHTVWVSLNTGLLINIACSSGLLDLYRVMSWVLPVQCLSCGWFSSSFTWLAGELDDIGHSGPVIVCFGIFSSAVVDWHFLTCSL